MMPIHLNIELFDCIAKESAASPRLRKAFDLRDSKDENTLQMLNILLPDTKTAIHRHLDSSELVLCIYGLLFNDSMMQMPMRHKFSKL